MTYIDTHRVSASAWKAGTTTLTEAARRPAPYVNQHGRTSGRPVDFCLPPQLAASSLLPDVRGAAMELFGELGIPWHAGVDGGPSNHLLSSQVQCVNALGPMVSDPERLRRAFGPSLGTAEVLQIEPGRYLTFEYIGPTDCFGEAPPGTARTRGARCTSVDAAFLHRTHDGVVELVLVEWKYTESYSKRRPDPAKDAVRWARYGTAWSAPDSPVRTDLLPFDLMLDEPFYQLMRQQLLAHDLEKAHAHGADRVRVVLVLPPGNQAYQQSIHRPEQRALGNSVSGIWSQLLARPDRFSVLDPDVFLDPKVTYPEYVLRYAPDVVWNADDLGRVTDSVDDFVSGCTFFDGDAILREDGVELMWSRYGWLVPFPFTITALLDQAGEVQDEWEAELEARAEDEE
jgi:hypothetical protein